MNPVGVDVGQDHLEGVGVGVGQVDHQAPTLVQILLSTQHESVQILMLTKQNQPVWIFNDLHLRAVRVSSTFKPMCGEQPTETVVRR